MAACAPAASTTLPDHEGGPRVPAASTLADLAVTLAHEDARPARKAVYLMPLRQLQQRCPRLSTSEVQAAVKLLGGGLANELRMPAPYAAAESALAAAASPQSVSCTSLASWLLREVDAARSAVKPGWGGYAGELVDWRRVHRADPRLVGSYLPRRSNGDDAFQVSGSGRVLTLVERFSPSVTADLALASIVHSLLPGTVRVGYSLKAAECQQAIYLGGGLGQELGNAQLGAFVELSSGKGVGHTPYDAKRVDRARITPLGRIGGQPCT